MSEASLSLYKLAHLGVTLSAVTTPHGSTVPSDFPFRIAFRQYDPFPADQAVELVLPHFLVGHPFAFRKEKNYPQ